MTKLVSLGKALQSTDGSYAMVPNKVRIELVQGDYPTQWFWRVYYLETHEIMQTQSLFAMMRQLRKDGIYPGRAIWQGR